MTAAVRNLHKKLPHLRFDETLADIDAFLKRVEAIGVMG
jgi:hypothetical protein